MNNKFKIFSLILFIVLFTFYLLIKNINHKIETIIKLESKVAVLENCINLSFQPTKCQVLRNNIKRKFITP